MAGDNEQEHLKKNLLNHKVQMFHVFRYILFQYFKSFTMLEFSNPCHTSWFAVIWSQSKYKRKIYSQAFTTQVRAARGVLRMRVIKFLSQSWAIQEYEDIQ